MSKNNGRERKWEVLDMLDRNCFVLFCILGDDNDDEEYAGLAS